MHKLAPALVLVATLASAPALAQFTGPGAAGALMTASQAGAARAGTYVTLEGSIVAHLREDYYTFRDASGDIRVEIAGGVFAHRPISSQTRVRLLGEVDSGRSGPYVWVKSLDILP